MGLKILALTLLTCLPNIVGLATVHTQPIKQDYCFDIDTNNLSRALVVGYAEKHAKIAFKLSRLIGVPASVILAQAVLESSIGKSDLAKHNNHFGVQYYSRQFYPTQHVTLWESGKKVRYCKYASVVDSYLHHSKLLALKYPCLLHNQDYKAWLRVLQGTYTTQPNYAECLEQLVKMYRLDRYDKCV